jgi:predicted membrane-bound spermidine synthase
MRRPDAEHGTEGEPRMTARGRTARLRTWTIFGAFALSGCAGLIYQSIWARYLGLFLGHAAYAQSLVLAIFMGGMALGAWWAGARAAAWNNLLRGYAMVELCIGLAAAVFHPLYLAATQFAYDHGFPALAGSGAGTLFKWSLAGLLIFPQSVLLGATFPLLSNALMRRSPAGSGSILGGLYFTNSIGAAAGALFATFVLLPAVGLPGAMAAGALLNVLVALIAFALAREAEPRPVAALPSTPEIVGHSRLLLPIAAFVTGATSFVYEIGWVRMLSLAFGTTTHVFEIMLAAFIGGLACGAAWIRRRIDRYAQPLQVGGTVQIAMGIAALVSLVLYNSCFDGVAWAMSVLPKTDRGYDLFNIATATGAIAMMLPTAFFAGMTLPLFTVALMRDGDGERSVGRIYSANTLGAIAGIYIAVHWLIPLSGLKATMITAASGDLALGLVLLLRFRSATRTRRAVAVSGCLVAIAATALSAQFDPMAMAAGVYRRGSARFESSFANVVFYRDGETASVATIRIDDGEMVISTNGKADASIQLGSERKPTVDEITMVMSGVLPLAMHPAPQTAAVIGFGAGLSTHTLLGDPRLHQVDTIEIEPAMVEGAKTFGKRVARAFDDPRSRIRFDDAKAYFASNLTRYDIIVSEPSNPWVSGVEGLFSTEFYKFVPRHLQSGGLFVQWVQLYDINDELLATIGRSLAESFADFRVYLTNDTDAVIVATPSGSLPELHDEVFRQPALTDELRHVGLASVEDLKVRQVGDRLSLLPMFNAVSQRSNSDFYPILSLEGPRARFIGSRPMLLLGVNVSDLPVREVLARIAPPVPGQFLPEPSYMPSELAAQSAFVAAALVATQPGAIDTPVARAITTMRMVVAACADESGDAQKIDFLQQLAARTIPYLDAEHLQRVWNEPDWIECATPTEAVRTMIDVVSALARRDFSLSGFNAVSLLQAHRQVLSQTTCDWLLRAAMLSAIAEGRYADVATLDSTLGSQINSQGWNRLQRTYLIAFAREEMPHTTGAHR